MTEQVPPEFIEWDYDQHIATRWRRLGECNHCGQCCKDAGMIHFDVSDTRQNDKGEFPADFDSRDGGDRAYPEGVWSEVQIADRRVFFGNIRTVEPPPNSERPAPCPAWIEGRCSIHAEKPGLCVVWPTAPKQVEGFSECSYTFEKVAEWPFEDVESEA